LWSFHAADDTIALASCTEAAIARINAANPAVVPLKTIWPTGGHIVWDRVYTDTSYRYQGIVNIYEWFLGQNKSLPVNKLPVANAGPDVTVNSTIGIVALNASASTDADGKLVRFVWRKIGGPAGPVITTPFSSNTVSSVSGLTLPGTYTYELAVVDNRAAFAKDTVNIRVFSEAPLPGDSLKGNRLPIANAGLDRVIQLTWTNRVLLNATLSKDTDGWIKSVNWVKVSGPEAAIDSPSIPKTFGVNLVPGTYKFRAIVTDNKGGLAYDDMIVFADSTGMAKLKAAAQPVVSTSMVTEEVGYAAPARVTKETAIVYPNPAAGKANLLYESKASGRSSVRIYDVSGRLVKTFAFQKGEGTYSGSIDLGGLKSGMYYVEISTGNSRTRTKLIKE
jgi:hypothetical protein